MRRVLRTLMVAVLIFTIVMPVNAMAQTSAKDYKITANKQKKQVAAISEELVGVDKDPTETVRVIVELEEAPIIDYATKKGVQVKDLSQSFVESTTKAMTEAQSQLIDEMDLSVSRLEIHEQFTNVFNGFSATTTYGDVEGIAAMPGVKSVNIANEYFRPEPQMVESTEYTQHKFVNEEYGYTGEGMIVAIIDTGIDYTHKDFVLDEGVVGELTSDEVATAIEEEGLLGAFYSEKVPYGYNYMDHNNEILDLGIEASMHGMHVAGTVAANGDEDNGGIKGVAPNAQVLALKVFGNDPQFPSTFGDIIIAAIDDAIILGADVMNLSLGSTAAFVDESDPEQMAVTNAVDNGILMSISAGNSASFGAGYDMPYAENPDVGVVGAPGITSESLQVASVNNKTYLYETTAIIEGMADDVYGYGKDMWDPSMTYEIVAIGGTKLGDEADYEGLDVTGKVVLVSRGAYSFFDKTETAAAQGAIGIIVYDHGLSTFYKDQGGWSIPFMKITLDDGLALEALLESSESLLLNVAYGENGKYVDPVAGLMSDFSSWGTTPDLSFKPEIAAPGGNIYSTFNNDTYGFMSGTSMAAPHVSGGAALVIERIKKDPIFADVNLDSSEIVELAKNIMMNTAVPVMDDKYGFTYASPRQQGAGSMNLAYAMDTEVVVTDATTGVAKVNLQEISTNVLTFDLELKNYGEDYARFIPESNLQAMIGIGGYNYQVPAPILHESSFSVSNGGSFEEVVDFVDVPGGETVILRVLMLVDPSEIDWMLGNFYNGFFLEGFINLYTDDEILGQALALAYGDVLAVEDLILAAESELEGVSLVIEGLEGEKASLEEELAGLEAELAAMMDDVEAVWAKQDAIELKEIEIQTLTEIYERESYLFALLVGDLLEVTLASEYLEHVIAEYEDLIKDTQDSIDYYQGEVDRLKASDKADKPKVQKMIACYEAQIAKLEVQKAELEAELEQFKAVMEDFELYEEVYLRHRQRVADAEAMLETAQAELLELEAAITDDDQAILDAYEAKKLEIEAKRAEIEAKTGEIQAANDVYDQKVTELLDLYDQYDEAYAAYAGISDEYFNALPLSVPFISYFGDWSAPRAFDVSYYEAYDNPSLYPFYYETYMISIAEMDESSIYFDYLGIKDGDLVGDAVAISPDGDGYKDNALPRFSVLRNLSDVTFRIENEEGYLQYLGAYPELRKNYYYYGTGNSSYILPDFIWDGDAKDGQYYYIIDGALANGDRQELVMPVYVDTVAPIVEELSIDENGLLQVVASDIGVGIDEFYWFDLLTGQVLGVTTEPEFDPTTLNDSVYVVSVAVFDYAGNVGEAGDYEVINDNSIPEVRLDLSPFSIVETREFDVHGYVEEELDPIVFLDGEQMILDENYEFTYHASYDSDGKKFIQVDASDFVGNDISFRRYFYIDSLSPVITALNDDIYNGEASSIVYVGEDVDTYNIQAVFEDNFPDMTVKVNKDAYFVSSVDFVAYEDLLEPVVFDFDYDFSLDYGYNTFVLDATDVTGKLTTETIVVHRAVPGEVDPGSLAESVTINTEPQELFVGDEFDLDFEVMLMDGSLVTNPDNALIVSDSSVIAIDGLKVKAEAIGQALITVTVDGVEDTLLVDVVEPQAQAVTILNEEPVSVYTNESFILNYTVEYEDGSMVSNDDTASIESDSNQVTISDRSVKASTAGTYTVTVTADGVTDELEFTVTNKPSTPSGSGSTYVPTPVTPAASEEEVLEDLADEEIALASPLFRTSKYINGYTDGSFAPDGAITRAEISAIINRVVVLDESSESAFNDVTTSFWALKHIATMEKAGLIKGYMGLFKPNDNITRAEMATILSRIIGMAEMDIEIVATLYTDIENHWSKDAVELIYSYGIEISEGETEFLPDQKLTRAEAVVMINQLIGAVVEDTDSSKFNDVDAQHWAYRDIMSAAE